MPTNKRITDLTDFTSVLPYASEMFGVYQPMIGWKSKRIQRRYSIGLLENQRSLLQAFATNYAGAADATFSKTECVAAIKNIDIGRLAQQRLIKNKNSVLIQSISNTLPKDIPPVNEAWRSFIDPDLLRILLNTTVAQQYATEYRDQCRQLQSQANQSLSRTISQSEIQKAENDLITVFNQRLNNESAMAGALLGLFERKLYPQLESLFYTKKSLDLKAANRQIADMLRANFARLESGRIPKCLSISESGGIDSFFEGERCRSLIPTTCVPA
jgi:hypothetical protein